MEPDSGIKKVLKKICASKSDGYLNLYDTDAVMSDGEKSCLSFNDDNGLAFAAFNDAFNFKN